MTYFKFLTNMALSDEKRWHRTHPSFNYLDLWPIVRRRVILEARGFSRFWGCGYSALIDEFKDREWTGFDEHIRKLDERYVELSSGGKVEFMDAQLFCDCVMRFYTRSMSFFDPSNYTKWMSFPPGDLDIHKDPDFNTLSGVEFA